MAESVYEGRSDTRRCLGCPWGLFSFPAGGKGARPKQAQTFCAVFFKGLGLEYGPWELQFQPPICGNNYMSLKRDSGGSWLSPFALLLGTKEGCS